MPIFLQNKGDYDKLEFRASNTKNNVGADIIRPPNNLLANYWIIIAGRMIAASTILYDSQYDKQSFMKGGEKWKSGTLPHGMGG